MGTLSGPTATVMITITPILERDGDRHYQGFFLPEFVTHRLGKPGQWQGGAMRKLGLSGPVQRDVFASLLQGRTPEGEELLRCSTLTGNRVLGWRITLTAEGPTNTLWALSSGPLRGRIQLGQADAARAAAADFENRLNGRQWWNNAQAPGLRSVLFAKFQSGASPKQTPRLETTLFLFNLLFHTGKENMGLQRDYVTAQQLRLHSIYAASLGTTMLKIVGGRVQVPPQLALRFQGHPPAHPDQSFGTGRDKPLQGHELSAAWREQARSWGWGPERTAELIHNARPTWSNLIQDYKTLGRLWALWAFHPSHSPLRVREVLTRSSEQSRAQQSQSCDHDHGMSH
jgi:hypothetical protein